MSTRPKFPLGRGGTLSDRHVSAPARWPAPGQSVRWITDMPAYNGAPFRPHPAMSIHEARVNFGGVTVDLQVHATQVIGPRADTYIFAPMSITRGDGRSVTPTHMDIESDGRRCVTTLHMRHADGRDEIVSSPDLVASVTSMCPTYT